MIYTFDLRNKSLATISGKSPFECENYYIDYIGEIKGNALDILRESRFNITSIDYSKWFNGPYLLIIYDKNKKSLFVTSHKFGSPVPIYLMKVDRKVIITTALSDMKEKSGVKFALNNRDIPCYLRNGYITGANTLINNLFKLPQGKGAYISGFGIRFINNKFEYFGEYTKESDIEKRYYETVKTSVKNNIPKLSDGVGYSMALSGGFDSNSILFFIKELDPSASIDAVSIGGIRGRDESIVAREIADYYEDVSFESALVTPETFKHLDEIVDRLEGNVFENGVFLQYELAKYLSEHGRNHLVCGECADQVFHAKTYERTSRRVKKFSYENTPLEMAAYTVFKKSSYMLESFGIKGYYPFLDREMICFGHDTVELNGCTKEFHKDQCRKLFKEEVAQKLIKQGGTTQMMALFDESFDCKKAAEKSKFYDEKYIPYEFGPGEQEKVFYAWLKYLEIFEEHFCDR